MRYDGERFHKYGEKEGLSAEVGGSYAIGQDGQGNLWVGMGNAIYRWDGQQFQADFLIDEFDMSAVAGIDDSFELSKVLLD